MLKRTFKVKRLHFSITLVEDFAYLSKNVVTALEIGKAWDPLGASISVSCTGIMTDTPAGKMCQKCTLLETLFNICKSSILRKESYIGEKLQKLNVRYYSAECCSIPSISDCVDAHRWLQS
jgi:hypothetical protein